MQRAGQYLLLLFAVRRWCQMERAGQMLGENDEVPRSEGRSKSGRAK